MPSISATGEGIEDVASYLAEWIRERLGGSATLLRYGGHPIVYGRVRAPLGAWPCSTTCIMPSQ
ncbi:MAG TPA: hypothetical protein EYP33_00370 [Pyrodictium sp.]|nr:hypothetical protein [Pyrodictium sp.]